MVADTRLPFTALVGLVALARLAEIRVSRRHVAALLRRGGVEVGARHYPAMGVLRTRIRLEDSAPRPAAGAGRGEPA